MADRMRNRNHIQRLRHVCDIYSNELKRDMKRLLSRASLAMAGRGGVGGAPGSGRRWSRRRGVGQVQ